MIAMTNLFLVGLGGAVGAMTRFLIGGWVSRANPGGGFPVGTLTVNITGCLAAGLLAGFLSRHPGPDAARLFLMTGVLGGYTTFSAFSLETIQLLQRQAYAPALANALFSICLGLLALYLGIKLASL